jgi:hypothetical protein
LEGYFCQWLLGARCCDCEYLDKRPEETSDGGVWKELCCVSKAWFGSFKEINNVIANLRLCIATFRRIHLNVYKK